MNPILSLIRRVSLFLSANFLGQLLSGVSGILLARWLNIHDYAIYSVTMVVIGAVSVLTKGGVHLGFTALLGHHWKEKEKIQTLLKAVRGERRLLSVIMVPPILIVNLLVLRRLNAPALVAVDITSLLIAFWWADVSSRVIDQVLIFDNKATRIQILDAILNGARLSIIAFIQSLGKTSAVLAIAINVLMALARVPIITLWIRSFLSNGRGSEVKVLAPKLAGDNDLASFRRTIRATMIRQVPADLFYVLQAQLTVLVLSIMGSITHVADYGALSRIAQILAPFTAFSLAFLVPYFSKLKERVLINWCLLSACCALPGLVLTLVAVNFSELPLMLVGAKYSNLHREIVVCTLNESFISFAYASWNLVAHRGWNRWAWLRIPLGCLWCMLGPFLLDLHTLIGALWFNGGFALGVFASAVVDIIDAQLRLYKDYRL